MKAIILAANQSNRLHPFTETRAKPMMFIAGKMILETTIQNLYEAGIKEIAIVVNHQREQIEDYFSYGKGFGVNIDYIYQEHTNGIGNALQLCESFLGNDKQFMLVYGDVLTQGNIFQNALETYYEMGKEVAVVTLPRSSKEFGNVYLDPNFQIQKLIEKPKDSYHSNYVFAGAFILSQKIFSLLAQNQMDIEKCYQDMISDHLLYASIWEDGWIDLIFPWHIIEANRMILDCWQEAKIHRSATIKANVQINGCVVIEEGTTIESGTILNGPCYIGKHSYIGNNVLIRPYCSLGPNSIVGYGTELKNSVLFGSSIVGRLSFVGESVIGQKVKIGSAVTTVNHLPDHQMISCQTSTGKISTEFRKLGSFIGENTTIGARHTIAPGTIIASNQTIPDVITIPS